MKTLRTKNGSAAARRPGNGLALLGLALLLGAHVMVQAPALAQEPASAPEPGGRYQPEKTVADYDAAVATAQQDGFDYAAQTLRVGVWLDRDDDEVYQRGDDLQVSFEANEDAYAVVYRIDSEGVVTVLRPRSQFDDGFVFGGHEYKLPVGGKRLRVEEAEGEGFVEAIVSRYPFDLRALELDFLHDASGRSYEFRVAGDPFLAMNEINYSVTGLEDSGQYVVTNYAQYYVHRKVDHPRYLCSQCHFEDDVAYDPYTDNCTLSISYDYHWGNRWYATYGFYPVYWNPVYVYVDPWTWRPWVNFWYRPYYTCAPYYGWYGSYWGSYGWWDSPYYHGDCWTRWDDGHRRYRPLSRYADGSVARKTREYAQATTMVKREGPDASVRTALRDRTALKSARGGASVRPAARGEQPAVRTPSRFDTAVKGDSRSGLRIRDGSTRGANVRVRTDGGLRHTAGGATTRSELTPVVRSGVRAGDTRDGGRAGEARGGSRVGDARTGDGGDSRTIRSVAPSQRGSRVWNSRGSEGTTGGARSSGGVRAGDGGTRSSDTPRQVRPQQPRTRETNESPRTVRERAGSRATRRSDSSGAVQPQRNDGGASRSSEGSSVKSRSGGSSDSGGSSRSSGGSSSGGGSRSSGGSRSGGSSRDRGGTRSSR